MVAFELDAFYLMLANGIIAFPKARELIDELYQSQRFRFYAVARENKYYDSDLMKSKPLKLEVSMKRAYGIILCSQDDEQLQGKIIAEIYKIYSPIKKQVECFSVESSRKAYADYLAFCNANHFGPNAKNAFYYFVAYILSCKYGFDVEEDELQGLYKIIAEDINEWQNRLHSKTTELIDSVKAKELLTITRNQRRLIERIQTGDDFANLLDALEYLENKCAQYPLSAVSTELLYILRKIKDDNPNDVFGIWVYCSMFNVVLKSHGLTMTEFFSLLNIDKMERNRTLKLYAYFTTDFEGKDCTPLSLPFYFIIVIYGQLAKLLKNSREFYFSNNSETQYNELQRMSAANAALKEQVAELTDIRQRQQQHIDVLNARIESLSAKSSKDEKDAMRPLKDEISMLRSQITALQNELDAEREKTAELSRLREFVFSLQSGQDIPDTKTSLGDLIFGKRIYIFGGHINWRNKMKAAYPALNIVDGHNESFDEQLLLNADMVLLNTSNMSHALYYKVIDVLRKNKIPFDYIGKYNNIELMEQEIAAVLQK